MEVKLSEKDAGIVWRRIEAAEKFAKDQWHADCKRASDLYAGMHWPGMDKRADRARIVVNYCKPTVETKVANIAFAYPAFTLKPLNAEGEANVPVAEQVLRYDWRTAGAQREARRALRDREIFGLGVIHDFWLFETEPAGGKEGVRVEGGRPAEAVEEEDQTPDTHPVPPVIEEELEGAPPPLPGEEPAATVRSDRPAVKRISPQRFFVDLEADAVLENAAFCGFVEWRPLEEVRGDKRLKNTKGLKGSAKSMKPWLSTEDREREDADQPADVRRVKLFHYYEKRKKLHAIFCDEHRKPLLTEPWRWEGDWYPFSILRAPDDEDCFYPTPPLLLIEHQQREINESRTQHSEWRGQSVPKYQCRAALVEEQKQAITSTVAGTIAENMGEPVTPIQHAQLQPEVLQAASLALQDLQFIAGLNDYETSNAPGKRMTSAEVEAVRSGGGSRGAADRQAFEMFCAEIAEHMLAWEQQYSVRSRQLPIFDRDENVSGFIDFTPEQIRGKFSVEVYVGSTTAPNPEQTLQGIAFAMQSLAPLLQTIPVAQQFGINLQVLIPKLLKAALPEIRDIDQMLQQQPPMMPMASGGMPPEMAGPPPPEGGMPVEMGGGPAATDPQAQLAAMLQAGLGG